MTRADLARHTGLARSTVAQRVDALLASGLLLEAGGTASTGGRPATALAFNHQSGVVLVADLGATHARVAVTRPGGRAAGRARRGPRHRARARRGADMGVGALRRTARRPRPRRRDLRGIGIGVRARSSSHTGRPVNPPIMPGWDGFDIPAWFADRYSAPVLVDNDVNIMARGEHWVHWRDTSHLLLVKVGTGIGCGIVADGHIHRGARGAAGDIGHIRATTSEDVICRCGNIGCLEAVAGGQALATRLDGHRRRGVEQPRRGPPGPRGQRPRDSDGARRGSHARRGPGRHRQLLQPGGHRDRRGHRARPTHSCSPECARESSAARSRSPRATCASCPAAWATARA